MKYLLFIALLLFVFWMLRGAGARRADRKPPPDSHAAERMVRCAQCGVHLPVSESLEVDSRHYCCVEHRDADAGSR